MADNDPNILCGPNIKVETPNITIGEYIFERLKSHKADEIMMNEAESGNKVTALEFLTLSAKLGQSLSENGLRPGDVVCIIGKASIVSYAVSTGTLFQGGVVSPLDHNMEREVVDSLLLTIEPSFVFCDSEFTEGVTDLLSHLSKPTTVIVMNQTPDYKTTYLTFEKFLIASIDIDNYRPVSVEKMKDEVAFLVCSSGTRGTPKPVMLTHKNVLHQVQVWRVLTSCNKIFSGPAITFSYFFWISGVLLYLFVQCLDFEMTIVQRLEATHVLQVIEEQRPIWGMFSPAFAKYLTCHPDFKKYNVSSIVLLVTGGCSLQKPLVEKIKEQWGPQATCKQAYGLTEVTGSATACSNDDDILSVGRLLPGFKMKVVSLDDGSTLGPGQHGEIYLKSPTVMKGYMNNEEASRAVLNNQWFRSEDVGYYTETGLVYITGRIKDIIVFNKWQIYPQELEDLINYVPGVNDVGVTGVKVDDENALLTALVVKGEGCNVTKEDIDKSIEHLPDYKHLRGGVYFVDTIPKTSSGKIKRGDLLNLAKTLSREQ